METQEKMVGLVCAMACGTFHAAALESKLAKIKAGGGAITKLEKLPGQTRIFFDVPRTYPGLSPQALEKFKATIPSCPVKTECEN